MALSRDGGLEKLDLKGDLDLRIASAEATKVVLSLAHSDAYGNDLQFKTHPRIDKKAWTDSQRIQLRDTKQGFPVRQGLAVLKWRLTTKDESVVPLSSKAEPVCTACQSLANPVPLVNCWPSPTDNGTMDVNIEYELTSEDPSIVLKNIIISIPLPDGADPSNVNAAEGTTWTLDNASNSLNWLISEVDASNESSRNGVLEFNVPGDDTSAVFPVAVDFVAQRGLCGVEVSAVKAVEGGADVPYSTETLLSTDDFAIV